MGIDTKTDKNPFIILDFEAPTVFLKSKSSRSSSNASLNDDRIIAMTSFK